MTFNAAVFFVHIQKLAGAIVDQYDSDKKQSHSKHGEPSSNIPCPLARQGMDWARLLNVSAKSSRGVNHLF